MGSPDNPLHCRLYFDKWKKEGENPAEQYDTRTEELPADVTELPDETKEFIDDIAGQDEDDDEHFGDGRPTIEPASLNDWNHGESKDDGAYRTVYIG